MKKNGILSRLFLALVFLFLYAPILVLIVFSFNDSKSNAVWGGFTLDWYVQLLNNRTVLEALRTTLLVSVLATAIATVAGTAAAIGFSSMKRRPRNACLTVNSIPMTNADIITGVSMIAAVRVRRTGAGGSLRLAELHCLGGECQPVVRLRL